MLPCMYSSGIGGPTSILRTLRLHAVPAAPARGDRVEVRGFGRFAVKKRDTGIGRNPRTGESVAISEKHRTYFRIARQLHPCCKRSKRAWPITDCWPCAGYHPAMLVIDRAHGFRETIISF